MIRRTTGALAAAACVLAAACAAAPPAARPARVGAGAKGHFAVAAETTMAARAAADLLRAGGSAADAAIGAALVSGVVAQQSSGIGGGGFAMAWSARDHRTTLLDFREAAPAALDVAAFDTEGGPAKGARAGVPGEAAGLWELHRRFGKLPFARDAERAIAYAETGFAPERHFDRVLRAVFPTADAAPGAALRRYRLEAPAPPWAGAASPMSIANPPLGATLRRVANEGPRAFYEGPIARCVVDAVRAQGGAMTEADVAAYRVIEREPLHARWEGREVYTMPPPSGGGLMVLETLGSFSAAELATLDTSTPGGVHALAEVFRGALADRLRTVADPAVRPFDAGTWLAPERLRARRAAYRDDATQNVRSFVGEDHGTSHMVVVDAEGNVVTLTTTVNGPFGARFYAEPCGVLVNDELMDFTPRKLAERLGVREPPGAARAGARPPSSMTPTIIVEGGRPVLALGGSGGMRIATGVTQVIARVLGRHESVDTAVRAPRLHVNADGELVLEPNEVTPEALADLERRGERARVDGSMYSLSAVQAVEITPDGPKPAADPRKYGATEAE